MLCFVFFCITLLTLFSQPPTSELVVTLPVPSHLAFHGCPSTSSPSRSRFDVLLSNSDFPRKPQASNSYYQLEADPAAKRLPHQARIIGRENSFRSICTHHQDVVSYFWYVALFVVACAVSHTRHVRRTATRNISI